MVHPFWLHLRDVMISGKKCTELVKCAVFLFLVNQRWTRSFKKPPNFWGRSVTMESDDQIRFNATPNKLVELRNIGITFAVMTDPEPIIKIKWNNSGGFPDRNRASDESWWHKIQSYHRSEQKTQGLLYRQQIYYYTNKGKIWIRLMLGSAKSVERIRSIGQVHLKPKSKATLGMRNLKQLPC